MVNAVEAVGNSMEVGTRVRVSESVIVYNHPEHRNKPFDMKGQEGEVIGLANHWHGKPISANFPYIVRFSPKHKLHFHESELEVI
jgi:hypothetical protein